MGEGVYLFILFFFTYLVKTLIYRCLTYIFKNMHFNIFMTNTRVIPEINSLARVCETGTY